MFGLGKAVEDPEIVEELGEQTTAPEQLQRTQEELVEFEAEETANKDTETGNENNLSQDEPTEESIQEETAVQTESTESQINESVNEPRLSRKTCQNCDKSFIGSGSLCSDCE